MVTQQVAERLGVTRQRALTLAREGKIKSVVVGGRVRIYNPASVEKYARERSKP